MDVLMSAYVSTHNKLRVSQIQEKAEAFGVDMKTAITARLRYLYQIKRGLEDKALAAARDEDGVIIEAAFRFLAHRDEISKEIKRTTEWWKKPPAGSINDDMIARAKEYPIEQLVEFDRAGKAMAWCHADKSPSMTWWKKGNRAKCWPCDKSYGPIDVLMERDGMSFVDAVKTLQ